MDPRTVKLINLGFQPRSWQDYVFRRLKRFNVVIVHRRAGKTIMAILKLIDAAIQCNQPLGRFGYLAPELKQAKAVVWEILKAYAQKIDGVTVNESELWVRFPHNNAIIRLFGADNMDALRGLYFDGLVVDEVAQMNRDVWGKILLPALTDRHKLDSSLGWALFIGTPDGINLLSELYYRAMASDEEWFSKLFTVYDTGVFTGEEIAAIKRETKNESDFRQEWLCDFQASSTNVLITLDAAREATTRILVERQISFAPRILGVDVAWEGGDRSVIFKRQGLASFEPISRPGVPEKAFSVTIARVIADWKPDAVFVDVTGGYGGEVVSRLTDTGFNPIGIKFSASPSDERFLNLRAEMWFNMAQWIRDGGAIPNDEKLIAELCSPTYDNNNAANKLQLESKKKIKDRLGFSPDMADALALTFAQPVAPKDVIPVRNESVVQTKYNPFSRDRL